MKIYSYKGLSVRIMLRDEHCPPHAHVKAGAWSARFKFSFWHNNVELWDVIPLSRRPPAAVLEGLRQSLKQPVHLLRARGIWWRKIGTICLENQLWDWQSNEVVVVKGIVSTTNMIGSAHYESETNKTRLSLIGMHEVVEIEL